MQVLIAPVQLELNHYGQHERSSSEPKLIGFHGMTPQLFAQVALTLKKFGDIDRKLQLEKYFYKLPEPRKLLYINVLSEQAASNRNTLVAFFDFVKFPLAFQLRDSPPETHEVLLEAVVKLLPRYEDAAFLDEALEVLWNWSLPDNLLDRAYSGLVSPYIGHPDERIRIAAIRRIGKVVRRGGALNNPTNVVQLIEGIWEDEASSPRMRAGAIFALNDLTGCDRETDSLVSKMVCAALRSEVSEFRHEAVLLIAREQSWRISHELRQDAFQSLLRILKEEHDMDSFLLTAFDRVPGEIPEWAQRELAKKRNEQRESDQILRTLDSGRSSKKPKKETEYDIAISFAGEDRKLAETLAEMLVLRGVTVFYDDFEKADLWGKDLFQHLQTVYRDLARYCLVLISHHYTRKPWTRHELRQAQERALKENAEYILPVRLDDSDVPGLAGTTAYLDARTLKLDEIADLAVEKLHAEG